MATCTHVLISATTLPHGQLMARGNANLSSSYSSVATGDYLNLANIFANSPTVIVGSASGYMLEHNQGSANSGTIRAKLVNQNTSNSFSVNAVLTEVTNGTDLSAVNFVWTAVGRAY